MRFFVVGMIAFVVLFFVVGMIAFVVLVFSPAFVSFVEGNPQLPTQPRVAVGDTFINVMVQRVDLEIPETKVLPMPAVLHGNLQIGFAIQAFDSQCQIKPRCKFRIVDGEHAVINTHECGRRKWEISDCYVTECNDAYYKASVLYKIVPDEDSDINEINDFWDNL